MKLWYRVAIAVAVIIAAIVFFKMLIGSSTIALLSPAGTIASQEYDLIKNAILIMLIIVVPFLATFYWFAWRYRAGNSKAKYDPDHKHNAFKELGLWVFPSIIVAVLAVFGWNGAHAVDPYQSIESATPPITIQVIALPWKWLFIYPGYNIATVNLIEFPVNRPVHFELTADGPISSFWIPQLGSQIYAMAAMQTQLNLMADKTGDFVGKDTEINGAGYSGMTFVARSTSQADFDAWVQSLHGSNAYGPLTEDSYAALAATSTDNPPAYYSFVDPGLFDNIVMKFMVPEGTPAASMPANMPGMKM